MNEQRISYILTKYPNIKKVVKRIYHLMHYRRTNKKIFPNDIVQVFPNDEYEYFFGYYDKTPFNISDDLILAMRVHKTERILDSIDNADLIYLNLDTKTIHHFGNTNSWNNQQGCMLQWLGPDYNSKIIYNKFYKDRFISTIYNRESNQNTRVDYPIYSVSNDGKFALSLDFTRLHLLRPGYGYANISRDKLEKKPSGSAIYKIDLVNNRAYTLINFEDIYDEQFDKRLPNSYHMINHIMISPDNKNAIFHYILSRNGIRITRLLNVNISNKNLTTILDYGMISHCNWVNNDEIVCFAYNENQIAAYYRISITTGSICKANETINKDGHPTYNDSRNSFITDTYPDKYRQQSIIEFSDTKTKVLSRVYSPFKFDNEYRCDLHPRLSHKGDCVIFDSVLSGKRNMYYINIKRS